MWMVLTKEVERSFVDYGKKEEIRL